MIHFRRNWQHPAQHAENIKESGDPDNNVNIPVSACVCDHDPCAPIGNGHRLNDDPEPIVDSGPFADPTFYLALIVAIYLLITVPAVGLAMCIKTKTTPVLKFFER